MPTAARCAAIGAGLLLLVHVPGCYSPGGGLIQRTGGGYTFISTSARPVTVAVVNTCERSIENPNGTAFFVMEIPPGKQLSFNFEESGGDDPALRPSRMFYAVWEQNTWTGSLNSELSCCPEACRRIDVSYRTAPELPKPDDKYLMTVYDGQAPSPQAQPRAPRPERSPADR